MAVTINKVFNYARMRTTTTGTGTITLGAAVPPFLTFAQSGVANGDVLYYSIIDIAGNGVEAGIGTYSSTGPTLTRTTILRSSGAGNTAAISLSGNAEVHIELLANAATGFPALTLGQVPGTTTNDLANSGNIGELQTTTSGAAVSLTSATPLTVLTASIPAGDWEVSGNVQFSGTATSILYLVAGLSLTTNVVSIIPQFANEISAQGSNLFGSSLTPFVMTPVLDFQFSTTTNVFLVAQSSFTGGTNTATSFIRARRVR